MRILHLTTSLSWTGGIETYLLTLLPILEEKGHPQVVAHINGDVRPVRQVHHVPSLGKGGRTAERQGYDEIRRLIAKEKPSIAHVHNIYNIGAISACLQNIPTVVTTHNYQYICPATTLYYQRNKQICRHSCDLRCFVAALTKHCMSPYPQRAIKQYRRSRWALRHAKEFAGIIAPSGVAADLYARAGFPEDRITVLPYFCSVPPAMGPSVAPTTPTVMFMGRVRSYKGYDYFIRALGLLPSHVRGIIVGDLSSKAAHEIDRIASDAGCGDRLERRPWAGRESVAAVLAEATVFVFPSIWPETLGIVGIEALSCGIPVVASDVGGVREWLRDGKTGILVPPKDEQALAAAVRRILESDKTRQAMARNGLALIREAFSPEVHVRKLLSVYEKAIRGSCSGKAEQGTLPKPYANQTDGDAANADGSKQHD
ncbi:MAG: glycosyltransferase family 4 protein [Candidatus Nealsonbacteria bacterium]|nr:glycosyltransferase family 4 protein [Candidatus Nealsonbacteria bacterium]